MSPPRASPCCVLILYFASIRTHLGVESENVELPLSTSLEPKSETSDSSGKGDGRSSTTLKGLRDYLLKVHPHPRTKAILDGCMWSVNEEMVDMDEGASGEGIPGVGMELVLKAGDIVGVIPPVSGG